VWQRLTATERGQGGRINNPSALGALVGWWLAALLLAGLAPAVAATDPGTSIRNRALVSYLANGSAHDALSNEVVAVVQAAQTPSAISILRYNPGGATAVATIGPTQCRSAGTFAPLAAPALLDGTVLNPAQRSVLSVSEIVHGNDPVFVRLTDGDQNRNSILADTVDIQVRSAAGDTETLRLTETGPDTGEFVGYIATSTGTVTPGDCVLQVVRDENISTSYTDPLTPTDTSGAAALVDPYGLVFDSSTGTAINGARVRLIDALTGLDAVVYGDDGVSRYPAQMVTGNAVTDAGGTSYTFPTGVFRFPLVAPGQYRLIITPPGGYAFASQVAIADLQLLGGAPYRLGPGSYGNNFSAADPAGTAVDVPLDPTGTALYLQKSTTSATATLGDFVQFTLTARNAAGVGPFREVTITDELPTGMSYRSGSTRIGQSVAADPLISADGRQLQFTTGRIVAGASVSISYVVEITASAHGTRLTNVAHALAAEGVASNSVQVSLLLREELFRDAGTIAGRVVIAGCDETTDSATGVAGVRVYMEDGRYALTDTEGKYHFDGVTPGARVVQLDLGTVAPELEPRYCAHEVRHAGRAWSQFVELRGGSLWRADFRLANRPPPAGDADLKMATAAVDARTLAHTLSLRNGAVAVTGLRLRMLLPQGLGYVAGSARLAGATISEPVDDNGVLSFMAGALPAGASVELQLQTHIEADAAAASSIKAFASFATPAQLVVNTAVTQNTLQRGAAVFESGNYRFSPHFEVLRAELSSIDRAQLDMIAAQWRGVLDLRVSATGHTDSTPIAVRNRRLYADNYALSLARAQSVTRHLATQLGIDATQVQADGKGPDEPLQSGNDAASLAANRRVEITISGQRLKSAETVTITQPTDQSPAVATVGTWKRAEDQTAVAPLTLPSDDTVNVEDLSASSGWILPGAYALPVIPSIKVAIAHAPSQRVELAVNGAPVSPLNFDGVSKNLAGTVALSRWRGVDLVSGANRLVMIIRNADGSIATQQERLLHYGDGAVHAELVREQSVLSADGTTRPILALRMSDRYGKPARGGTVGAFSVNAPYRSWYEVRTLHENQLLVTSPRQPVFEVGRDGVTRIELEPTTQAGTVVLQLQFSERHEQELHVWLEPAARDWILVGVASGTATYNKIADNLQRAQEAGLEDGYSSDGRVAFFAKGTIKGKYLLTSAFDSARDPDAAERRLLGAIEPDRYYTIYGDASEQRFEAASTEKLYLKLERGRFYSLFGDFETGLTVTDLARYSRSLTGFKSEYSGERFSVSGFATNSDQGYIRDQLAGDGTSGLYQLSRRELIINSDKLRIEVRDRIRSDTIVETRTLARFLDYSIDYINGTVFFRQPVPNRDENFNPVFVVAEYEVLRDSTAVTAGARTALKLANQKLEVGTTLINQGADSGDSLLGGVDLRWDASTATRVRAEVAHTDSKDPTQPVAATAWLAELTHVTENVDARVYAREQQSGFGLGQQLSLDTGTRRIGADGNFKFATHWQARAQGYLDDVLSSGATRQLGSAELRRETTANTMGFGLRHVSDDPGTVTKQVSEQAFINGSLDLWQGRVQLRAAQDLALAQRDESSDFPDRTMLGVDYRYSLNTTLFADHEHTNGAALSSDMTRIGVRSVPWKRAQVQSSIAQQFTEFGPRTFSTLGLSQGWQANEHWTLDLGLDQTQTLRDASLHPHNLAVPLASGSLNEDYFATFIGALYRSALWTFTSRLEHRDSDSEQRWVLSGGFYREPLRGHAFSMATTLVDSAVKQGIGSDALASNLRLSWAFRPVSSRWIVLDRLDLKLEDSGSGVSSVHAARIVNNFNANWQINTRTQLGLQLAGRYSATSFAGDRYSGISSLLGFDYRRDLTRRLDMGLHGTSLQSWRSHVGDTSLGIDAGINIVPNVWISLGYNWRGFSERDFQANRYTASGPYLNFRMKLDQDTFKDLSLSALRAPR
jgi:uncharacterized repeat protein (TIGR01451 family)